MINLILMYLTIQSGEYHQISDYEAACVGNSEQALSEYTCYMYSKDFAHIDVHTCHGLDIKRAQLLNKQLRMPLVKIECSEGVTGQVYMKLHVYDAPSQFYFNDEPDAE